MALFLCIIYLTVVIISDRREIESLQSELTIDLKTGLQNQAGLRIGFERLYSLLSRQKEDGHICVLYFDLDNFKTLNDTRGHHAGDEAIRAMAEILRKVFRRHDTLLARSNGAGDEFIIMLPNATESDIEMLHYALSRQMEQDERFRINESLRVTASVGLSICQVRQDNHAHQAISQLLDAHVQIADRKMQLYKQDYNKAR